VAVVWAGPGGERWVIRQVGYYPVTSRT